ncbi:methyltransferase domain-containing protein [Arcobacter sp.]|uniref:methyltransferase domain-containing protein n=1 Tax=Arcobacter sp. TaxID=1872629 RepID=UPI003C739302
MFEQTKATKRRFHNGNFHNRYFTGDGIDIGGKPDPFSQYIGVFPLVKSVKVWDLEDGDAQFMESCSDEYYDFICSSHCLEHMVDVYEAFKNWIRITKKGGYLIITVPDEDMYEQKNWPSIYNSDHKWTFTINKSKSWSKKSINIFDLLKKFEDKIEIEKIEKVSEFYNHNLINVDQTLQPNVESAIEFIIKKKSSSNIINIEKDRFHLDIKLPKKFEISLSKLYNNIEKLKSTKKRYLVYGYGSVAKILEPILNKQIVAYIDNSKKVKESNYTNTSILNINEISTLKYDFIIISVLGREKEISSILINEYKIQSDKLIKLT